MPVILLTNHYSSIPLEIVKKELCGEFKIISLNRASKEELLEHADKADYFLVSGRLRIDRDVVQVAKKLKMVQRTGVGFENLDIEALNEKGIPVYINHGINSNSVGEHTIMLILAVLRRLVIVNESVKDGYWLKQELGIQSSELAGKTVGIVGLGNIGKRVVELLRPFGVKILYCDKRRLETKTESELNLEYCSLKELLKRADILSLHCPLNSETVGMIGRNEIASMKPHSIIINTSRGQLIDEDALIDYLKSGHIGGIGLDVFSCEPLPKNSELLTLENSILTPHIGGVTREAFRRMMSEALNNIKLFEEGKTEMLEDKRMKL